MKQQLWLHEVEPRSGIATSFQIQRTLCHEQSPYQEICIYETLGFGRMMTLDGCIMTTERDEFLYHEMLVHPALCCHPHPTRALVIGGGDGGTVRELLRYDSLTSIEMVELDEAVVRCAREYLPSLSCGLDDPRVTFYFQDGVAFLKEKEKAYDIILIDSTDPVGPAAGLISNSFYESCARALRPDGILALQSESPLLHEPEQRTIFENLRPHFALQTLYHTPVVAYPSGWWSFAWASQGRHPLRDLDVTRATQVSTALKLYNPAIHRAAFALPNFVKQNLSLEELS